MRINCAVCKKSFQFSNPAVSTVADLLSVTVDCPHCGADLKAPDDEITMIPMAEYMRRSLVRQGIVIGPDAEFGYIEVRG